MNSHQTKLAVVHESKAIPRLEAPSGTSRAIDQRAVANVAAAHQAEPEPSPPDENSEPAGNWTERVPWLPDDRPIEMWDTGPDSDDRSPDSAADPHQNPQNSKA